MFLFRRVAYDAFVDLTGACMDLNRALQAISGLFVIKFVDTYEWMLIRQRASRLLC